MSTVPAKLKYSFKQVAAPGKPDMFDDATALANNVDTIVRKRQTGVTRCLKGNKMGTFVKNYQGVFKETLEKQYRIKVNKNSTLATNMRYRRDKHSHRCFTVEQNGKPSLLVNSCENIAVSVVFYMRKIEYHLDS